MQQSVKFHGLLKTPAPKEMKKRFSQRNSVENSYCMLGKHIIGKDRLLKKPTLHGRWHRDV